MCNRSEIVTNGCSGACCEKFTLPVSLNDLQKMKNEWNRVDANRAALSEEQKQKVISDYENSGGAVRPIEYFPQKVTFDNGYVFNTIPEDELNKLIDMLIFLGESEIDPQYEISLAEKYEYDPAKHSPEFVVERSQGHNQVKDGKLITLTYTCKYFDKENRICSNYENRPLLCRNFGSHCNYKGCNFTKLLADLRKKEVELGTHADIQPLIKQEFATEEVESKQFAEIEN